MRCSAAVLKNKTLRSLRLFKSICGGQEIDTKFLFDDSRYVDQSSMDQTFCDLFVRCQTKASNFRILDPGQTSRNVALELKDN